MKNKPILRLVAISAMVLISAVILGFSCLAETNGNYTQHTVTSGETLSTIAKKYGVTLDEIVTLNNIKDVNYITAGTVLKIPSSESETEAITEAVTDAPKTSTKTATVETIAPPATKQMSTSSTPQTSTSQPTTTQTAATTQTPTTQTDEALSDYSTMLTSFDTKISVAFVDTDIRDALSAFALNMGYNIIYKGDSTKITMTMKDVTMGDALDYMMKLTDLTYILDGNTIIVGPKSELVDSFSDASKITEFTLKYVSADIIIGQISTFGIPVTATLSGGSEYRFIAQGLPADLARVRDLIAMVDRSENSTEDSSAEKSSFYSVDLKNISASDFQKVLSASSVSSGVILSDRPNTLYLYVTPTEYATIKSIKSIVDVATPAAASAEQETIVAVSLKYVTVALIEAQIKANATVTIIKISTNESKLWLKGYSAGIQSAKKIIALLDIAENAAVTEAQLVDKFTPVTTTYITAERLKDTLSKLSIDAISLVYEENPKTLYIYATDDDLVVIKNLLSVIDIAANAEATTDEVLSMFRPIQCTYISAAQLNTVLKSMSLPTGIIFDDNPKTLYIYASESDFTQISNLLLIIDTQANADSKLNTSLKSVTCRFITAVQLNTMLKSMSLPTGIYFEYNPQVLYLNVTDEQLQEICEVATYIDTLENSKAGADSFNIYLIGLTYINVDKAVEFVNQLGLELDVIQLSSSQKKLWLMGEYTEYLKAKAAIAAIDVASATLTGSFDTFTLYNITAGEAKKLIDNAALTGVLTYIPNGQDNGSQIVVYFPNDSYGDIQSLIKKIDSDQSTYTKVLERLPKSVYSTADDPNSTALVDARIQLLAKLSGVSPSLFYYESNVSDEEGNLYYVLYLQGATMLECTKVQEVLDQISG
jgi:Type II secretory pathway, component PulD